MSMTIRTITCNHFTKRGPKSFLLKSIKIKKKSTELPVLNVGLQNAHYSNVKTLNVTVKLVDIMGHLPTGCLWLNVINDGLDDL